MSSAPIVVHGVWSHRGDSLTELAQLVSDTFSALGALSPLWKPWYRFYRNKEEMGRGPFGISNDLGAIRAELELGQVNEPERGGVQNQLGYSMRAWSGPPEGRLSLSTQFRVTASQTGPYTGPNVLALELPSAGEAAVHLREESLLVAATLRLARIWRCDWIIVWDLRTKLGRQLTRFGPNFGWINYLARGFATVEGLPGEFRWAHQDDTSCCFVFREGMPSEGNPEHARAFEELTSQIELATDDDFWVPRDVGPQESIPDE